MQTLTNTFPDDTPELAAHIAPSTDRRAMPEMRAEAGIYGWMM